MNITLLDVTKAKERIQSLVLHTPLMKSFLFSDKEQEVFLKLENVQRTGSFKLRGAYNRLLQLTPEERTRGVIAASAGNHAQGVALSAKELGIHATICMPENTPLTKIRKTQSYGAEVVLEGANFDAAYAYARTIAEKSRVAFIHPFDDVDVIAGQGTIALEILADNPHIDAIVIPIGGGGLASGIAVAAKAINPHIKIIGVEAEGAASFNESFQQSRICTLDSVKTLADGIAVKRPGEATYELLSRYLDALVLVNEDEIKQAIMQLLEHHQILVEGAGAVAVAAFMHGKIEKSYRQVALITSGGNLDLSTLSKIVDYGLMQAKRRISFTVELEERASHLHELMHIFEQYNANIYAVSQSRNHANLKFGYQDTDIVLETNGEGHAKKILQAIKKAGFVLRNA
ncbi:threonine ammonia-lyase [Entomospira culicis]|uniref:Threonine ammonia-lyase n=1 Tax=Entomospira culicis TaxID=2719989 RepID=A0A968GEF1_9SPIO|nr:threonine ammonia-lyase [Entomospira culicis]NIZ18856.1 threonine ammonia-lyase [Entomospira culicis]NIZ69071.1 threonine ammonia-lyase [Entomospira culicis]WDI37658.1 threonine ammonia-lyase [Entomospira culicis]WDI39286.1 threonine ammonia-lyase [Entomospira culicis]